MARPHHDHAGHAHAGHDHGGHDHRGHGPHAGHGPAREPESSLLRASALTRLAGAGLAVAAIWGGVLWAMS